MTAGPNILSRKPERSLPPTPVEALSSLQLLPSLEDGLTFPGDQFRTVKGDPAVKQGSSDIEGNAGVLSSDVFRISSLKRSSAFRSRHRSLQHHDSVRSTSGYSIIDAYAETTSPVLISTEPKHPATDDASVETVNPNRPMDRQQSLNACLDIPDSPASVYPAIPDAGHDLPVELCRVQLTGLREKLSGIQDYLQAFGHQINTLADTPTALANIHHVVKNIHLKIDCHKDGICLLRDELADVGADIQKQIDLAATCNHHDRLEKLMEDMWHQSCSEFPRIMKTLEQIQEIQVEHASIDPPQVTLQNLKPSSSSEVPESQAQGGNAPNASTCYPTLQEKLDELLALFREKDHSCKSIQIPTDLEIFPQTIQEVSFIFGDCFLS